MKSGGYICKKQRERKKMYEVPDNFCIYDPLIDKVSYKSPQYSFKQSAVSNVKSNENVGPGTYNIEKTRGS